VALMMILFDGQVRELGTERSWVKVSAKRCNLIREFCCLKFVLIHGCKEF